MSALREQFEKDADKFVCDMAESGIVVQLLRSLVGKGLVAQGKLPCAFDSQASVNSLKGYDMVPTISYKVK